MAALLVPSVSLFHHQSGLAEAQQVVCVVSDRIRQGLLSTLPQTIATHAGGTSLSWRPGDPLQPFSPTGQRQLRGHFMVYSWNAARQEVSFTPWSPGGYDFTTVAALSSSQLPPLPTAQTRVLGRHVTHFHVTFPITFPLQLEITVSPPGPRRQASWSLRQQIMPAADLVPE